MDQWGSDGSQQSTTMTIVLAEVTIPSESFELGEILHDHQKLRIELTPFVPTGNGLIPYFWVEAADQDEFAAAVRRDERVAALTVVDEGADKRLYHIEWADSMSTNGFLEAIRTNDVIVESGVGTSDTWRFTLRAATHDALASFQQFCTDNGIELAVHRVYSPATGEYDTDGLTVSQRDALRVASRLGYFQTPSRATLEEVGEELGISSQAASRRIRRAVETLVDNTVILE
ncbi:helix-turn-helix domain-containing protein [Halogranum rubrum]|nr:helix-turn-helix domain-containing protein [Halogranum rubrum]